MNEDIIMAKLLLHKLGLNGSDYRNILTTSREKVVCITLPKHFTGRSLTHWAAPPILVCKLTVVV